MHIHDSHDAIRSHRLATASGSDVCHRPVSAFFRRTLAVALVLTAFASCTRSSHDHGGPSLASAGKNVAGAEIIEEILRIGGQGLSPDEQVFGRINDLTVDAQGNILVVDSEMKSLSKLNAHGELLWSIDQIGQGPGEIMHPWLVDCAGGRVYLFDIGKKKILIYNSDSSFEQEIAIPYFLYGMSVDEQGSIYASGVITGRPDITTQQVIHTFSTSGELHKSFALDSPFYPTDVKSYGSQLIIHQFYAGRMSIERWGDDLLVSPVFDRGSFLYSAGGELLGSFENSAFSHKLLNYEVLKNGGASFNVYETQSGPALSLDRNFLLKAYQIASGEELAYTFDVFDSSGAVRYNQIPVAGLIRAASARGLLFAVRNLPYPQIYVYQIADLNRSLEG